MGRRPRATESGSVFHVMNRGVDRQPIFFADADRVEFGRRLADVYERFGVEVLAYCLMTNHYHLVLRVPEGNLSEAMHHFGSVFVRHTNDRIGRDGPLFRGRFVSVAVTTDAQLLQTVRYVHRNALDLPGITSVDSYRWSSLRAYLGYRRVPRFLNTRVVVGDDFDPAAFLRFHDDDVEPLLVVERAGELDRVIEHERAKLSMVVDGLNGADPTPISVVRALAIDRLGARFGHLADDAYSSIGARHSALSRARARAQRDSSVDVLVANVVALVA